MTTESNLPPHCGVMLPMLSDEAAVEIYLFVEALFQLVETHYGDQISRHFEQITKHNPFDPDFDSPLDEPF